jgi:hypothetical protein
MINMTGFITVKDGVTDVDELWRYAQHLEAKIERMQRGLRYIKQTAETDDIPQLVALCDEALGAAVA